MKNIIKSYGSYAVEILSGAVSQLIIIRAIGLEAVGKVAYWQAILILAQTIVDFGTSMSGPNMMRAAGESKESVVHKISKMRWTTFLIASSVASLSVFLPNNLFDLNFLCLTVAALYVNSITSNYIFLYLGKVEVMLSYQAISKTFSLAWVLAGYWILKLKTPEFYYANILIAALYLRFISTRWLIRNFDSKIRFSGIIPDLTMLPVLVYSFLTTLAFNFAKSGLILTAGLILPKFEMACLSISDRINQVFMNLRIPLQQQFYSAILTGKVKKKNTKSLILLYFFSLGLVYMLVAFFSEDIIKIYMGPDERVHLIARFFRYYALSIITGSLLSLAIAVLLPSTGQEKKSFLLTTAFSGTSILSVWFAYHFIGFGAIPFGVVFVELGSFMIGYNFWRKRL